MEPHDTNEGLNRMRETCDHGWRLAKILEILDDITRHFRDSFSMGVNSICQLFVQEVALLWAFRGNTDQVPIVVTVPRTKL